MTTSPSFALGKALFNVTCGSEPTEGTVPITLGPIYPAEAQLAKPKHTGTPPTTKLTPLKAAPSKP